MKQSLKNRTVSAICWSFVEKFGIQVCSAVVQLVLARMIAPTYFGVVATAMIVLNILRVLVDAGFGAALIQRKDISRTDISTVFYLNVAIAFVVLTALCFCSGSIAQYFDQPQLVWIVPALCLTLVAASFGQAQSQMLAKQLKFKFLAKIALPAVVVGGGVGIVMAVMGANVWALIAQQVITSGIQSILLWVFSPTDVRPNFSFSISSVRKLSGFSLGVLGNEMLRRVTQNLTGMITAKAFGVADLAFYNQARYFQRAPTEPLVGVLGRVLFPVFSEIQDQKQKLRSALRRGIPVAIGCVAPLMFWMIATAKPMVVVLLTDVWRESIQYLRILPLMGITLVLSGIKSNVIRSQGDGKLVFLLSLYRNSLIIAGLWVTWRYGVLAMILGQVVCFCLNMVVNDYFTARYTGYSMKEQWSDWVPYVLLSAVAAAAGYSLSWTGLESLLLLWIFQTLVLVVVYVMGCWFLDLVLFQIAVQQISRLKAMGNQVGLYSGKGFRN